MERFYELAGIHSYAQIPRLHITTKMLEGVQATRILDLGCADGSIAKKIGMIVTASQIYGVDISRKAVAKAISQGLKAQQLDLNEGKLPFDDASFDLVIALEIIEHLLDPDAIIEEIKRVLSSEGILVLSTPNLANWMNRISLLFGYQPWGTEVSTKISSLGKVVKVQEEPVGHLRLFTMRAFKEFAIFHGLKIKQVKGANFLQYGFLGLLDSVLSHHPSLACVLIFLLEK